MKLKPFRDYSEHEVVNLFALDTVSGDKGCFVQMLSFDPDNYDGFGDQLPGTPSSAYSADYDINAFVRLAPSGTPYGILGLLLFNVRETMPYLNTPAILADPIRLDELEIIPEGMAVPILSRGIVEIGEFEGVPFPGSGAIISDLGSGIIKVAHGNHPRS